MDRIRIDPTSARRFVLGLQGLWPGRRWRGPAGLLAAVAEVGTVQVDPLDVVGRSHDLALGSRVDGYRPEMLERALYRDRSLFEWGGTLQIRPIAELPYLRAQIRAYDYLGRRARFERTHPALLRRLLSEIDARGPLGRRDFPGGASSGGFRSDRESGLALYYLWLRGDLMIVGRENGAHRYDLTERAVPARWRTAVPEEDAEPHRLASAMRRFGLANAVEMLPALRSSTLRKLPAGALRKEIEREEKNGRLAPVEVDGWKGTYWMDPASRPLLDAVRAGRVPEEWSPLSTTTDEEATFLAPLEIVSARGRAGRLFDFEYLWEVYKPAGQRRWGYYTLPILYGDTLAARADLRYDRETGVLRVLGFWLETGTRPSDERFASAVGRGLRRLREMTAARRIDVGGVPSPRLRARVRASASRGGAKVG